MANNYYYIVAGFPELLLDFENKPFNFLHLKEEVRGMLDDKDRRLVDWLLLGREEQKLSSHFYRVATTLNCRFIRDYYSFDLQLRNILSAVSARKAGQDPSLYLIGNNEFTEALTHSKAADFGLKEQSELVASLLAILEEVHILEREQKIDQLRWEKGNEICASHFFDIDVILCFLLKASIIHRWMLLDKIQGQQLFKTLVKEITDTRQHNSK